MLQSIRDHAHGIFAKILLGLLALSFGVWGIGDIFRSGGGAVNVAKAGNVNISLQEYRRALRIKNDQLRQMLGSSYTPEMLEKMGLSAHVLFSLVNDALIAQEAQSLGIRVSDDEVRDAIAKKTEFSDKSGQFDKAAYQEILRSNGLSEARYVEDVRHEIAASVLSDTVTSNAAVNETLASLLYKARMETRSADFVLIPAGAVRQVPEPGDKDIAAYYNEHKGDFVAPEYRSFSVIAIPFSAVVAKITVPDSDIRKVYDDRKNDFHLPERRLVEQLVFDDKADADKAAARLAKGEAFADVAKSKTVTNKNKTDLGEITREEAPTGADAIFALKEGASTPPVQAAFGWHIFHVSKIEPEGTATFEQASPMIKKDLAEKQAEDDIGKKATELEDALAGGVALDKAAAQVGGTVRSFGPVAQDGASPDGRKPELPAYDNLLKIAFATGEKENAQVAQASDGSYFLVHVDAVTASQTKPLADVKPQVIAAWKAQKTHALLRDAIEAAAKDLQAGKPLAAALSAHGITPAAPVTVGGLHRADEQISNGSLAGKPLPPALLAELFTLAPRQTTQIAPLPDGSYLAATLDSVTPAPAADAKAMEAVKNDLKQKIAAEMMQDYLGYLRGKYHVSVNETALGMKEEQGGEGE